MTKSKPKHNASKEIEKLTLGYEYNLGYGSSWNDMGIEDKIELLALKLNQVIDAVNALNERERIKHEKK